MKATQDITVELYDIYYGDIKLNNKPMTLRKAEEYISNTIMNYGYRPSYRKI